MKHDRETRYKAAAALIATGNSKIAASESGVPSSTIRHWRLNDPDFALICEELRAEFSARIKSQLAAIIEKPITYHGRDRPAKKYPSVVFFSRFATHRPIVITPAK